MIRGATGAVLLGGLTAALAVLPVGPVPVGLHPASAATSCDPDKQVLVPDTPYPLIRLDAAAVRRRATGAGVTVAVVDSGVNPDNVHLRGVLVPGTSLLPGDAHPNGTTDLTSHGTAVAGIVAARPVAGSGLVGMAPDAFVLPIRVYASEEQNDVTAGRGPTADRIAAGIRYAADRGARIVVVPLALPDPSPALDDAVAYATGHGSLVVASAGNRDQAPDRPNGPRYPAASAGVLGVGAVTEEHGTAGDAAADDAVSDDSVSGPQVDLVAPGTGVLATYFGAGDCLLEPQAGVTSWAAGFVAGLAADVAQAHPSASPAELAYRLEVTADRPVRAQRDDRRGWGLIQPVEAIDAPLDPTRAGPPLPGAPRTPTPTPAPRRIEIRPLADPAADQKRAGGWWLLVGGGLVGLATCTAAATAGRRRTRSGPR